MTAYVPVLKVNGRPLSPASHRGVTMAYASIDGVPKPRRDDNWVLRASSRGRIPSRMFAITISGGFISLPPAWVVGDVLEVECSAPITEQGYVAEAELRRPAVAGSVFYFDADGRVITDPASFADAAEARWCPKLTMMVVDFGMTGTDMTATSNWTFTLEEVESPE